jgi:FkbH-like protein
VSQPYSTESQTPTRPEQLKSAASPEDELLRLHRAGRLAAEYPEVRRLLAGLSGDGLARAGRLLSRIDPEEVLRAHPQTRPVTVVITGHGTLNALVAPLTVELARHGLLLRPVLSPFDSYAFDLIDKDSQLYAAEPDLALCVLDASVVFDEVPTPWRPCDVQLAFEEKLELLRQLAARFGRESRGTLVLNSLPLPHQLAAQLIDHRSRAELGALWREANARLLRMSEGNPGVVVFDIDTLVMDGVAVADPRLSIYAKAPFSPELLAAYARQAGHLARHVSGRPKKVLAIDLDGTAWGGTLMDDGMDGIEMGDTYRGHAYRQFQQAVRQLAAQGVLVAAISKNDQEPVRQVLREHPDLLLREDDFVRVAANWRPKHENLVELAADLNVGVETIVFVDDSPAETGLARMTLPEVAVIQLSDEPAWHVRKLVADGWFDTIELTEEDQERPARYRDELERRGFLSSLESPQDYLRELQIRVQVTAADSTQAGRVSQLTLRTNQFNLTTQRLQPPAVQEFIDDPSALVLVVRAADRFGDSGLVGAIFARRAGDTVNIDNFLLSCRVFSRGVEQAALHALLRHALDTGARSVTAAYRRTAKNANVRQFYPKNGFSIVTDDGDAATFRHDLDEITAPPSHIELTVKLQRIAGK